MLNFENIMLLSDRGSGQDDDNVSIAGTVFNEPWDSNVWENLLDLANYGDEPHSIKKQSDLPNISCIGLSAIFHGHDKIYTFRYQLI